MKLFWGHYLPLPVRVTWMTKVRGQMVRCQGPDLKCNFNAWTEKKKKKSFFCWKQYTVVYISVITWSCTQKYWTAWQQITAGQLHKLASSISYCARVWRVIFSTNNLSGRIPTCQFNRNTFIFADSGNYLFIQLCGRYRSNISCFLETLYHRGTQKNILKCTTWQRYLIQCVRVQLGGNSLGMAHTWMRWSSVRKLLATWCQKEEPSLFCRPCRTSLQAENGSGISRLYETGFYDDCKSLGTFLLSNVIFYGAATSSNWLFNTEINCWSYRHSAD